MTREDQNLLKIDLCARIPYGVKVLVDNTVWCDFNGRTPSEITFDNSYRLLFLGTKLGYVKPYLFPLSSMSESQKQEFFKIAGYEVREEDCGKHTEMYYYDLVGHENTLYPNYDAIDWLNAHHFDYRGLINKGLAIDATNLNIYGKRI